MILLVGLPGSGKSTVGRQLARRLELPFVDTDTVIERRLGCSIRDYFAEHGEAAFRDVEQSVLDELCSASDIGVLATGGGIVLREANRSRMRAAGTVVYLRSTPEELARRLRHDTQRPLLQGVDPLQRLRELYAARDPLYRDVASFAIDSARRSVSMMVGTVVMQLELSSGPTSGSDTAAAS
ncbi:shikimate kinase [Xylophilus sp. GOD-11R]|uniref:shikimate kinase n=1 Tax=Xylophilus sp. GOD-11R TaxID=3089814 RepID=UPI00298BCCE3|nr:shikimate kinase [Xylophilus sp. GOD-11R]WPB57582.1 shikimate kinase [Xylophilus sp. GOD-11R]